MRARRPGAWSESALRLVWDPVSHPIAPVADELASRLGTNGHEVALVGGSVRDALLGRLDQDLHFATSPRPPEILAAVKGWADATWEAGVAFGVVGVAKNGYRLEITTYRAESYDRS